MNDITTILMIILATSILMLIYVFIYNHFQTYIIKINTAENNIDNTLRNKFYVIMKLVNAIEDEIKREETLKILNELKEMKISNFDLDHKLIEILSSVAELDETNKAFKKIPKDKLTELKEIDESLKAFKNYYNDNITKYNKLVRMFPTNIVGKITRLKEKNFYDGKNMNDEDIDDFKV